MNLLWEQLVQPMITEHRGRTVKLMGDGPLAALPSVVEAVQCATASAHFLIGQYAEALSLAKTTMRTHTLLLATCVAAASAGHLGDTAEAKSTVKRLRELDLDLRVSNLENLFPTWRPENFAVWADGLRKASLRE